MQPGSAFADFDGPSCSVVYLDKPMRKYSLRAKIVTGEGKIDIALAGLPCSEAMRRTQQLSSGPK